MFFKAKQKQILDNMELVLDSQFWKKVIAYIKVFKYFNEVMLAYQEKALNLSDFFFKWTVLYDLTTKVLDAAIFPFEKQLASLLVSSMDERKSKIIDYPGLSACLILDPRFSSRVGSI